jgi:SHS2 domain-containing protein
VTDRRRRSWSLSENVYETFDHTADLGLRIAAPDVDGLFVEAGRGLFSIIVENLGDVRPQREVEIRIDGTDREYLLFDWLNELLYRWETEHLLLAEFDVRVDESGLVARARGETADSERHQLSHEVKAITYHRLAVVQTPDGWAAEVIVDI